MAEPTQEAIDLLKSDHSLFDKFNETFGAGASAKYITPTDEVINFLRETPDKIDSFKPVYGTDFASKFLEDESDVSKAFSSGLARLGVAGSVVGRELGVLDDEDLAESLLEQERPTYSPETQAQLQEIDEAEGFFETLGEFITNPRAAGVLTLETIPQMAVSIPSSIVGGIVGSTTGPAGTAVGLGAGMALPTLGIEYGNVMA